MPRLAPIPGRSLAKICGLTLPDQALECARLGAAAIGLNFWPKSKRFLAPKLAADWARTLPGDLLRVGVFVNPEESDLLELLASGVVQIAQLHGDESPDFCARIRRRGHDVWKALAVRDRSSLDRLAAYEVDAFVLDAFCPGEYGGSGKTFDWSLAKEAVALAGDCPVILSGGLTPENVGEAIRLVRPVAVDVASGVEVRPGVKDMTLVERFMAAVRTA